MSPKTLEVIPFIIFYTNLIDHVVEDTLAFETALHTDWENNSVSSYFDWTCFDFTWWSFVDRHTNNRE